MFACRCLAAQLPACVLTVNHCPAWLVRRAGVEDYTRGSSRRPVPMRIFAVTAVVVSGLGRLGTAFVVEVLGGRGGCSCAGVLCLCYVQPQSMP